MGLSYALFLDLLLIPEFPLVISELDESYLFLLFKQLALYCNGQRFFLSICPSLFSLGCTVSYQMTVDG